MKYVSLFSGIEAASVAWKPLGWTPLAFAEIEAFPCAVLAHHYPDVPNHGDVTAFDWSKYRGVCDLLVGGSPCQSFSVAGLRGSLSDDRGNLALAFCKITHAIDPTHVVYENVPGILNTKDNAFGCLLAGLVGEDDALTPPAYMGTKWPDAGVVSGPRRTAAWRVLDAQFFGVPQRRRRVFVVSVRGTGNWRCAEALFPLSDGLPWDIAPCREAGARVAAGLTRGADSSGKGGYAGRRREDDTNIIANCVDAHMGGGDPDDNAAQANHLIPCGLGEDGELARSLTASLTATGRLDANEQTFIAHSLRAEGFDASEDGTGRGTPLVPVAFAQNQRDEVRTMEVAGALAGEPGMKQQTYVAYQCHGSNVGEMGTFRAGNGNEGGGVPFIVQENQNAQVQMREVRNTDERAVESCKDRGGDGGDHLVSGLRDISHEADVSAFNMFGGGKRKDRPDGGFYCETAVTSKTLDQSGLDPALAQGGTCVHFPLGVPRPAVAFQERGRAGDRSVESQPDLAYSLNAPSGGGRRQEMNVATPTMAVRRLTPAECEKLQGFSPGYTAIQYRGKPAADGPRYRAIGNSMAVPVLRWIGERIEAVEKLTQEEVAA